MIPIAAELRAAVVARARGRCEYCGMPDGVSLFAHEVDHIIAQQHRGRTVPENLALACFHCNRHKGPNIATICPSTGELIRLFHPRNDKWSEHFRFENGRINTLTPLGEGTAVLLEFNSPRRLQSREALVASGLWNAE